jgi:hypothetical protein
MFEGMGVVVAATADVAANKANPEVLGGGTGGAVGFVFFF